MSVDATPPQTIPVIDMAAWDHGTANDRVRIVETIGDALVDIGFFAVENHGVDRSVIDHAYALTEAFFDMPEAEKLRWAIPGGAGQRGYTGFGREHAKNSQAPDLKEFWHVGRQFEPGDPDYPGMRLNVWPEGVAGFRPALLQLYDALDKLAAQLLEATSLYIDEPPGYLPSTADRGDTILRLIHYPPVPADRDPASVRAAAHEDINLITILCEATSGGLELLQHDGTWRPIHALGGQLIVDSGDMIQHLSNGLLRSTTHRVVNPNNSRERRFSLPYFVHPRADVDLTPRPACVARTGGVERYRSLTAGQFLQQRLQEIGLGAV